MFEKKNQDPIVVVVSDGRWECFGPVTPRSRYLYSILESMGGVSGAVPNGTYYFNAKRRGIHLDISLLPHKD